jgi:hypothetical protein
MSARRFVLVSVVCLCSLAAGGPLGAPVAFAEACPNEAARSGPSASLPECRAYEMVTPADKSTIVQDLNFGGSGESAIAAVNGERIALATHIEGYGQTPGAFESLVVFVRTPSGWQTESVQPPGSGGEYYEGGAGYSVFTPDLTEVALTSNDEDLYPRSSYRNFRVGPWGGPFRTMATVPRGLNEVRGLNGVNEEVRGATPSFSSVFFESNDPSLMGSTVGTVEGAQNVYRWEAGRLSVVNVNAEGAPVSMCGAEFEAVSADGSKVFFMTPGDAGSESYSELFHEASCREPSTLYVREDNSMVDISQGLGAVEFKGASQDGSRVFFIIKGGYGAVGELYVYDTLASKLTDVTPGVAVGPVFPSQDGVRVYFQANEKLTPEAPEGRGMYRYNTETGETHFITTNQAWDDRIYAGEVDGNGGANMSLSPNGKYLIYYGEEQTEQRSEAEARSEDQVFRYDDENEQVTCVSCLPSSAPLDKTSELGTAKFPVADNMLITDDHTPPETFVTNEGAVFFESTTQLVPQAVNATGGAIQDMRVGNHDVLDDVYEWRDGVVSLIGSPIDQVPQYLLGVSEDGSNVFFDTHSQLVPQDIDNAGDIYDARVDGGFPPVVASAACQGDTCVHPPPALNDPTPGSLSFSGPGNPPVKVLEPKAGAKPRSKRCAKGKVRRSGKCVRGHGAGKAVRRDAARRAARGLVKRDRGGSR